VDEFGSIISEIYGMLYDGFKIAKEEIISFSC
jgi:hypothetical protein